MGFSTRGIFELSVMLGSNYLHISRIGNLERCGFISQSLFSHKLTVKTAVRIRPVIFPLHIVF